MSSRGALLLVALGICAAFALARPYLLTFNMSYYYVSLGHLGRRCETVDAQPQTPSSVHDLALASIAARVAFSDLKRF